MRWNCFAYAAVLVVMATAGYSCSMVHSKPELNEFTQQCTHCHGDRLQGERNTSVRCASCHELKPVAASDVQSKMIKDTISAQPHVHTAKNMFSGTPSCYNCHRFGSI